MKIKSLLKEMVLAVAVAGLIVFGISTIKSVVESHEDPLTSTVVLEKMEESSELATYKYEFGGDGEITDYRTLAGLKIPFTKNSVAYEYTGCITAGYNFSKIEVELMDQQILVTLPEIEIFSTPCEMRTISEDGNILNPIDPGATQEEREHIVAKETLKAIAQYNFYQLAEDHAKEIYTKALSEFEDYEVVFKTTPLVAQTSGSLEATR